MRKESKIIKKLLEQNGFDNKVSQRTLRDVRNRKVGAWIPRTMGWGVGTRDSWLFVYIHDWRGNPFLTKLQEVARENDFIICLK